MIDFIRLISLELDFSLSSRALSSDLKSLNKSRKSFTLHPATNKQFNSPPHSQLI